MTEPLPIPPAHPPPLRPLTGAGPGHGPKRLLLAIDHIDPTLLTALSAALGGTLRWQICPAVDAAAARQLLERHGFDAVVADLRGPDHAALALMACAREQQPAALRVLVANGESDTVVRALAAAQRVLPAPCQPSRLAETLARAAHLHEVLGSSRLAALLGGITHLPPAPRVYLRLTAALQDPEVGASDLADLVAGDPALAAAVLRLCNSAFFSAGRPLGDLNAAVMRLGTRTLRHLVLACEAFGATRGPTAADPDLLQRRSLLASVLAPLVLDQWAEAELVRSAALLADIGLLLPPLQASDGARPPHAEAGAALLSLWGLPEAIVEAAAFHHDPAALPGNRFDLVGAVHVSVALASGRDPDDHYLRSVGLHERLRDWRKLASELGAMV
jgi:HD-like signal output (HDOD) protein/CheY-like chemotaxis protein